MLSASSLLPNLLTLSSLRHGDSLLSLLPLPSNPKQHVSHWCTPCTLCLSDVCIYSSLCKRGSVARNSCFKIWCGMAGWHFFGAFCITPRARMAACHTSISRKQHGMAWHVMWEDRDGMGISLRRDAAGGRHFLIVNNNISMHKTQQHKRGKQLLLLTYMV